jgi:hypothetical protein
LASLTTFEDDVHESQNTAPSADSEMNQAFRETDYEDLENGSGEIEAVYPPNVSNNDLSQEVYSEENSEYQEYKDNYSQEADTQPSSAQSSRANFGTAPGNANRFQKYESKYQQKIQKNFLNMIAPSANFKKYSIPSIDGDSAVVYRQDRKMRHAGVQTTSLLFGPSVDTKFLLSEIRPWGNKAQYLPQKGHGLYFARSPPIGAVKPSASLRLPKKVLTGNPLRRAKRLEQKVIDQTPIIVTNSTSVVKT